MSKFENDLTKGSVFKQLLTFSLPFLLSNFLQAMYNVSDTLIVSWFAGPNTVSGVANGGQITLIIINFAIGFTVGGTVLISQYYGADKREELSITIGTMLTALTILSIVLSVAVIAFSRQILTLVRIPPEAFREAQLYMNICMGGTIFIFGYNAIAAILRGLGDSKNPLYFVLISGVINTLLDIPFVGVFHWGAAGDAASTVIAQAIALIMAIVYLRKKGFVFDFKLANFKINPRKLKLLLRIGIPTSVQNLTVGFSFLFMMIIVNGFGVHASAAMGIVGKFNGFAILPAIAVSSSVSSMVAQNLGAKQTERAKKTMYIGILLSLPLGLLFTALAFFQPEWILRVFTSDAQVIAQGVAYIKYFCLDYILVAFTFSINGLLMGAGLTTFTMINNMLSSVLMRVPIAYIFGQILHWGLTGVGLAAPVATVGAGVLSYIYYRAGHWKTQKLM